MKVNTTFQYKLVKGKRKDELGISHMGHWVRQAQHCKTACIEGNHMNMTREQLIEHCNQQARSIAKSILSV